MSWPWTTCNPSSSIGLNDLNRSMGMEDNITQTDMKKNYLSLYHTARSRGMGPLFDAISSIEAFEGAEEHYRFLFHYNPRHICTFIFLREMDNSRREEIMKNQSIWKEKDDILCKRGSINLICFQDWSSYESLNGPSEPLSFRLLTDSEGWHFGQAGIKQMERR
jgi:hypothetical protein